MKKFFNDFSVNELNSLFDTLSEPFVPVVFEADTPFYQTCILEDFLTEYDNGVGAMERLTSAFREGVLKFKRACDISNEGKEIIPDVTRECHNIWVVISKGTKGYITRLQGKVLNGPRKGKSCWYYYFVKSLEDLDRKELWFSEFDDSWLSVVLPEPEDCDYPVPDSNGKISYLG